MGWGDEELVEMGAYQIAMPRSKGRPSQLVITANNLPPPRPRGSSSTGAGVGSTSFTYDKGGTVQQLADRAGRDLNVDVRVASSIGSLDIPDIQHNETHASYLSRVAERNGFTFKIRNGELVLGPAHSSRSVRTDREVETIALQASDLLDWDGAMSYRGQTASVVARWHDPSTGQGGRASAGSGTQRKDLRRTYTNQAAAQRAASAALSRATADAQPLRTTLRRVWPQFAAHTRTDLTEALRPGLDLVYQTQRATHTISGSGASSTRLELRAIPG
jgi:phage protein D